MLLSCLRSLRQLSEVLLSCLQSLRQLSEVLLSCLQSLRRLSEMLLSCLQSLRRLSEMLLSCLQSLRRLSETLLSRLERFHQLVEGSRPGDAVTIRETVTEWEAYPRPLPKGGDAVRDAFPEQPSKLHELSNLTKNQKS